MIRKEQKDLWKYGISGDLPIITVTIKFINDIYVVKQILKAYEYFKTKNIKIELVIIDEENYSYENYIRDEIEGAILNSHLAYMKNINGGIFVLSKSEIDVQDINLIKFISILVIDSHLGNLENIINDMEEEIIDNYRTIEKSKCISNYEDETNDIDIIDKLQNSKYYNEYGAFSEDGKEYIIDYTKTDDLTEGLKTFADLEKTLYFKKDYEGLLVTEDETEAVIKIVGDKAENKAIITAVNVGTKKSEVFKGLRTKYTGSKLTYIGTEKGIINEIRDDYYTRNHYEYTFIYADEEVVEVEYKFLEGEGLVYNKDKSSDAKFRIDALYDVFQNGGKVYVDGTLLDSENYTSKSGSTIIILNASYLNTLSIGEHTLKVTFSDGKEVTTKFSVTEDEKEEEKPIIKPTTELEEKPEVIPSIENPKTGDEILTYGILGLMSLIGLIGSLINVNKKNN